MIFQQLVEKAILNPKQLFLLDGLGGILSAFLLGVVLVKFESTFGMPRTELYGLAAVACIFVLYDFCCYWFTTDNWRPFLKAIAIANLIYCCVSVGLMFYHYLSLTILGIAYFVVEIAIVSFIANIELKTAAK